MLEYFGPLLNQRLIDLDVDQKQDKYLAGCDPGCPWWEAAEEREEAIQAKLAEVVIPWEDYPGRGWLPPSYTLAHGVPDSERIYGSGYLARHPEVQGA
jgi:hypothetical protein